MYFHHDKMRWDALNKLFTGFVARHSSLQKGQKLSQGSAHEVRNGNV